LKSVLELICVRHVRRDLGQHGVQSRERLGQSLVTFKDHGMKFPDHQPGFNVLLLELSIGSIPPRTKLLDPACNGLKLLFHIKASFGHPSDDVGRDGKTAL